MGKFNNPGIIATAVALPLAALAGFGAYSFLQSTLDDGGSDSGQQTLEPVELEPRDLDEDTLTLCLALTASVPDSLAELDKRQVTGGENINEYTLAYGDPAITAMCGDADPEVDDTEEVYVINDVCWIDREAEGGTEFISVDREITVAVDVPEEYEQGVDALNELSPSIAEYVPTADEAPSGCTA
ncbi:DUF3515 family protein [Haloglycomyces albus]|uniref:DUF3515 family protein n=1 Tax=Haloglycomyces albus TaxID=526067 RepID=UPI00046CE8E6|nr:DUF3515 family protein [Haloglycomyces albus]